MQISVSSTLTLYHDGQFWVGIIEHAENERFGVARIVFGNEPSNGELLQFVITRWEKLPFFGDEMPTPAQLPKNPKRRQREASKALHKPTLSTKAQRVLASQREVSKESKSQACKQRQSLRALQSALKSARKRNGGTRGYPLFCKTRLPDHSTPCATIRAWISSLKNTLLT